jgi:hypothetical protein
MDTERRTQPGFPLAQNAASTQLEHDVTLVLPGEGERLRLRLMAALEQLGYRIINEQPIVARRKAQNGGQWTSANLLDFARVVTIELKSLSEHATRVTFDFIVGEPGMVMFDTKGDLQTLQREAEAIAALARHGAGPTTCNACGTVSTTESRFCRRCGAPFTTAHPAELDVLQLTAGERTSLQVSVLGAVWLAVSFLCLLSLSFISAPKAHGVLMFLGGLFGALGFLAIFFAARRLNHTLYVAQEPDDSVIEPLRLPASTQAATLPSPPVSVTEWTTELLEPEQNRQSDVPPRRQRETS